jgi:two-component system, chemotaxis family, sensor kinase CheA
MSATPPAGGASNDVLREFLSEGLEVAEKLDRDLVSLEQNPHDRELLSALEGLTHAGETLLSRLRDGSLELTWDLITFQGRTS